MTKDSSPAVDSSKALKAFESKLKSNYGDNYAGINQKKKDKTTKFLPTNFPSVNHVLGGGLPIGKFIEIYGRPSSGKSTISYQLIAEVQKQGKLCVLIDAENAYDSAYGDALGIDDYKLAIFAPNTAEEAIDFIRETVRSSLFSLIVIDSIASLSAKEAIDKTASEHTMAILPRLLSRTLPDICNSCAKNECTILAINQVRDNLSPYGQKELTPGGNAIKFHASIRLKVTRKEYLKKNNQVYAITSEIKAEKNKVAIPYLTKLITIVFPHIDKISGKVVAGIDPLEEAVNRGVDLGIIRKAGAWVYYQEEKFNGMQNCKDYFADADKLAQLKTELANKSSKEEAKS